MFFFNHARRDALRPRSLDEGRVLNFKRQIDAYLALPLNQQLQTDIPPVWKYEFQPDVIENLTLLSYGKCPFCEQTELRLQPYRFRPPAYVTPLRTREERLCYLWKAFDWENLFPICGECTPEDKSYFPVKGRRISPPSSLPGLTFAADEVLAVQEDALLVYPGELLMPDENFQIRTDGTWIARTERSAETIKNFNLNRPSLVRRRSHAIESQINALRNKRIFWNEKSSSFEGVTLGSTRYLFLWNLISQFPNYFVNLFEITSSDVESILEQWMESDGFKLVLEEVLQTYDLRLSSSSTPSRPDKPACCVSFNISMRWP